MTLPNDLKMFKLNHLWINRSKKVHGYIMGIKNIWELGESITNFIHTYMNIYTQKYIYPELLLIILRKHIIPICPRLFKSPSSLLNTDHLCFCCNHVGLTSPARMALTSALSLSPTSLWLWGLTLVVEPEYNLVTMKTSVKEWAYCSIFGITLKLA